MEENHNQNTYIIQSIDLHCTNSDEHPSKESVLNEASTPVLISTTELNNTAQYITCYENGEIVLNKINDSVVKSPKNKNLTITKKKDKSSRILNTNLQRQELSKIQQNPALNIGKKLCYEKPHNMQQLTVQSKHEAPVVLKHPRKQLIDHKIMISPREFKRQLIYTADTITTTKLAPCTRQQLVHVLNGITTLFAHPAHKMPNSNLMQLYVSRCTCKKEPNMMSADDMDLLPLIENVTKPSSYISVNPVKKIYGKRKTIAETSDTPKVQIIENIKKESADTSLPDSNINLSSIKKIYHNRICEKDPLADDIQENIDHRYSKKTNEPDLIKTNIEVEECDPIYTITLDLDNIKEEHITENQIVILSVDNDGELTENNINVLLDAANIKTEVSKETDNEVVALTRNVDTEDFNNKLSNIFVVRTSDENNDSEQILGVEGI